MEENRIPKKVLSMNLETTRLRGRQRNKWQDKVRKDGRLVGGIGWRERVHNREEWKKLLRTAGNCCILHMTMNECIFSDCVLLLSDDSHSIEKGLGVCVCACVHAPVCVCVFLCALHHTRMSTRVGIVTRCNGSCCLPFLEQCGGHVCQHM